MRRDDGLRVDGARLWASLEPMAQIGATPKGWRVSARADGRRSARARPVHRLGTRCGPRGSRRCDRQHLRGRAGRDPHAAPVLTGSHAGTQPTGGRYDGICGVLGGLEVVRALNDAGVETARPIDVVVWTHEEGSRFAPPMIASGVLAGVYSLDYGLSLAEAAGVTLGGAPLPAAFDRAVAAAPHAPRPMRITAPSGAIPARMRRRARHSPQLNRRLQQSSQTDSNNCDMLSYYE